MGSTGSKTQKRDPTTNIASTNPQSAKVIRDVVDTYSSEYPKLRLTPIGQVSFEDGVEYTAAVNGIGQLFVSGEYRGDDDKLKADAIRANLRGQLAGSGIEGIYSHEVAHILDQQLQGMVGERSPVTSYRSAVVQEGTDRDLWSTLVGRPVHVGDTLKIGTEWNYDRPFVKIDGKSYTYNEVTSNGMVSDFIVGRAIANVQRDWQELGYRYQPTTRELLTNLSGYARGSYEKSGSFAEAFAESHSRYHSTVSNGHDPLTKEVVRLTRQLYKAVSGKKKTAYILERGESA